MENAPLYTFLSQIFFCFRSDILTWTKLDEKERVSPGDSFFFVDWYCFDTLVGISLCESITANILYAEYLLVVLTKKFVNIF